MALPKRQVNALANGSGGEEWIDPAFVRDYPSIKAFLADSQYADGSARVTGSISLFTKHGVLTAAVNDNDRCVSGFVTAGTWEELLFKLEEGICADNIDWKARKPSGAAVKAPF